MSRGRRSAVITTRAPTSSRWQTVWKSSSWVAFLRASRNCTSSITSSRQPWRKRRLKSSIAARLQRAGEVVRERLGRGVDRARALRAGAPRSRSRARGGSCRGPARAASTSGFSARWVLRATASEASRASALHDPTTKLSKRYGNSRCADRERPLRASRRGAGAQRAADLLAPCDAIRGASLRLIRRIAARSGGATTRSTATGMPASAAAQRSISARKRSRTRSRWKAVGQPSVRRSRGRRLLEHDCARRADRSRLRGRAEASRLRDGGGRRPRASGVRCCISDLLEDCGRLRPDSPGFPNQIRRGPRSRPPLARCRKLGTVHPARHRSVTFKRGLTPSEERGLRRANANGFRALRAASEKRSRVGRGARDRPRASSLRSRNIRRSFDFFRAEYIEFRKSRINAAGDGRRPRSRARGAGTRASSRGARSARERLRPRAAPASPRPETRTRSRPRSRRSRRRRPRTVPGRRRASDRAARAGRGRRCRATIAARSRATRARSASGYESSSRTTRATRYRRGSDARLLRDDAHAVLAEQHEVVAAVGQPVRFGDHARAADRVDRRIARHLVDVLGPHHHHADPPLALRARRARAAGSAARTGAAASSRAERARRSRAERSAAARARSRGHAYQTVRTSVDGSARALEDSRGLGSGYRTTADRAPQPRRRAARAPLRAPLPLDHRRARGGPQPLRRLLRRRRDQDPAAPRHHGPAAEVLEPREHALPRARAPAALQPRAALQGVLLRDPRPRAGDRDLPARAARRSRRPALPAPAPQRRAIAPARRSSSTCSGSGDCGPVRR